ncbi:MAG: DUF484 family protein [Gammaproteobacteria bacterium]|nr:DUF484 family protein [Gammaproteobacteria bacterium]MCF6230241.1 DUF484 family protein [Gammaproteobacteria bacterium]
MSSQQKSATMEEQEKQTIEYLRNHPGFFNDNAALLAELEVPHVQSGNRVSLIERQVKILREQKGELKVHLQELIAIARDNDSLNKRLNSLTLALLLEKDREAFITQLKKRLHDDFAADIVTLHLREGDIEPGWQDLYQIVKQEGVKCGSPAESNKQQLFGEMADGIDSVALISLGEAGLLAIGSHDSEHFHKDVATDYLKQLAAVVKVILARLN